MKGSHVDITELLENIFTAEEMPEDAYEQIAAAIDGVTASHAETVSGLETANGDAMTNIARVEVERDEAKARIDALTMELVNVKAGKFDTLMGGGDAESADDDIAADPDEVGFDPDITVDDLVSKYTK